MYTIYIAFACNLRMKYPKPRRGHAIDFAMQLFSIVEFDSKHMSADAFLTEDYVCGLSSSAGVTCYIGSCRSIREPPGR